MTTKLHVGNLNMGTTSEDLERVFSQFGTVRSAEIVTRRLTGRSKGFAFVEMSTEEEAEAAIAALNGKELGGCEVTVAAVRPRQQERMSHGYGGYQRGGRREW